MEYQVPIEDVVLQFTVVVAAALAVQLPLERSRVPGIVGLIILGIIIGPGGLNILPEEPVVDLLGSIGLLFIMFIAGLEIDLETVRRHKREAASFGALAFILSLAPAVAIGLAIGLGWGGAILLGAAVSSHTLLSYPVVEKLGLTDHRPIVATIGGTLLTDSMALVLLVVVTQLAGQSGNGASGWYWPLLLLAALVATSLLTVPRLGRCLLEEARATRAEKALLLLAILLLLSVGADAIGTEDILGAFLAGVCLNRVVQQREELREHLEFAGRMLFIPFFFIETGMWLEVELLFGGGLNVWTTAVLLLAAIVLGKAGASWVTGSIFGYSRSDCMTMTGLSLPQAAATLAVVVTGRESGLFGKEVVDSIIVVIFVTCLLGPLLTRFAGRRIAASLEKEESPTDRRPR